ncbi:MAG: cobaltochelatase subunit CobN, partial [Dietzia cercidiphylli]
MFHEGLEKNMRHDRRSASPEDASAPSDDAASPENTASPEDTAPPRHSSQPPRITLLSTSDTDLLSARASGADWTLGNPSRLDVEADLPGLLDGADLVVVRILGSRRSWEPGFAAVMASGRPVVVLGGEQAPDADLMELSTVPIGIAAEAHRYLAEGGERNLAQLHAFLSDTVLLTGTGFAPPESVPVWGMPPRPDPVASPVVADQSRGVPRVGVLYYRAHEVSGNSGFAHSLA